MPVTFDHEVPIDLCRQQPDLIPILLREIFHLEVPGYSSIRAEDPNVPQLAPEDYRAENLKGRTAQFEVTLKDVKGATLPSLDDAEFLTAHGAEDEASLRAKSGPS